MWLQGLQGHAFAGGIGKESRLSAQMCQALALSARRRVAMVADEGTFKEINEELCSGNPLEFPSYSEKVEKAERFPRKRKAF